MKWLVDNLHEGHTCSNRIEGVQSCDACLVESGYAEGSKAQLKKVMEILMPRSIIYGFVYGEESTIDVAIRLSNEDWQALLQEVTDVEAKYLGESLP